MEARPDVAYAFRKISGLNSIAKEQQILRLHHASLRAVLSFDAKNAAIKTKNADLGIAVSERILGTLSSSGQRCTALKLLFLQRELGDDLLQNYVRL